LRIADVVALAKPFDSADDAFVLAWDIGGQEREDSVARCGGVAAEVIRALCVGFFAAFVCCQDYGRKIEASVVWRGRG
jgi:hypothetical protein